MISIKIFVGKFLENKLVSYFCLLIFYNKYLKFHNSLIYVKFIDPVNFVRLFFQYYEAAEIRFLKKYFSIDVDTLDIGAGMGVTMSVFKKNLSNYSHKIICVEAVKKNIMFIKKNFHLNGIKNFIIENKFFLSENSNLNKQFVFNKDFTTSHIVNSNKNKLKKKEITNLKYLINKYDVKRYQAIIDIEGGELNFTKSDFIQLKKCSVLIIEIHTSSNKILKDLILKLKIISSLHLINFYGSVFVFKSK